MPKRFSLRELALLTLPVLVIGAVGWWMTNRPAVEKPRFTFHIEPPTALEAFRGADAAFVIGFDDTPKHEYYLGDLSRTLQLKTPTGLQFARSEQTRKLPWDSDLWRHVSNNGLSHRFIMSVNTLPAGELQCRAFGIAQPDLSKDSSSDLSPLSLRGSWKIDRAQIQPLNLASWPSKPLVSLRETKITRKSASRGVTAECLFQLGGATMDKTTSFAMVFEAKNGSVNSWGMGMTSDTARTRSREWTVDNRRPNQIIRVTGRVSADNRWPLGFEIEPFNFKTAKVGQKLKFKQFPVPLPKG